MRLYDKLNGADPEVIGVVSAESDMTGLDIAAIPAVRAFSMSMKTNVEADVTASLQTAAREAGAKAFLHMEAGTGALGSNPDQMGKLIAETAISGGYDGLMLDIPEVTSRKRADLTKLVKAVNKNLGSMPFYLVVESPTREGKLYDGYHYETLAATVDKLVVKISGIRDVTESFAVSPIDPLEEMYYALATLEEEVGEEKLTLMLESGMDYWLKESRFDLSEKMLEQLLAAETTEAYYSDRYECAYLIAADDLGKPITAWYLTEDGVESRVQLAKSMGISQICVSDWDAATGAFLAGLN